MDRVNSCYKLLANNWYYFLMRIVVKCRVMSENLRKQPCEGGGHLGRSAVENRERPRHEGFEGMNYEQRRPSYTPRQASTSKNDSNKDKGKRRDEL
jgi:hypothetical protein